MNLTEIFLILTVHWIADFILQTDWEAKNKSKNLYALISHTFTYSFMWLFIGILYVTWLDNISSRDYIFNMGYIGLFFIITFTSHTATDYYTSKLNSKLYTQGKRHNFFVSVGFDQLLHYIQLFITYYLLFK